jgi:hypothetical protein
MNYLLFKAIRLTLFFLLFPFFVTAQDHQLYSYQNLSKFSLSKQKDSLKKNWVCPELFSAKATQKKFKEIWDQRIEFISNAIEANDYVNDGEVYKYVNKIIDELARNNPSLLKQKQLLLIDRSASVNAYALGNNIIAVNLGLVIFSKSREEIGLVIAHELSHNILNHVENSMKEKAVWLTSDEYQKSINSVLDSKYDRLTKLKKVIEGYSFSRTRHNRYHENDADSLAIILLKNSKISFDPNVFLRLDSIDSEYKQVLLKETKSYFTSFNTPIEDWWFVKRTKGLSSKNYNFKDTSSINDSLKTHPDCIERYKKNLSKINTTTGFTPVLKTITEKANKMLIWNLFDNLDLTACLYRIMLEKDKGNTDPWYDFMIHNVFSGLYYSNKQLNRFNAIGIRSKEYISKNYYELQNMLEQIPSENLEQLYTSTITQQFWASMSDEFNGLKLLMKKINFESDDSDKRKSGAAKDFINNNPTSMYCEFAEHFKK